MQKWSAKALLLGLTGVYPSLASAESPTWPPGPQQNDPAWRFRAGVGSVVGWVPEFRQAERRRTEGTMGVAWKPASPVRLDLFWSYLADSTANGNRQTGPGDIRLGTDVRLLDRRADLFLGWQMKMPNASDELELGTDETDSLFWLRSRSELGAVDVGLTTGLAILGNPLQFANQDDVPLSWLDVSMPIGPVRVDGRVGGGWATSRNPSRMEASLGVEGACPWLMGARAIVGLTPAAPDWGAQAWIGWGLSCPE